VSTKAWELHVADLTVDKQILKEAVEGKY